MAISNGITANKPTLMTRPLAMEALKLPEKRPKSYASALELCRVGRGWTRPDLINHACRGATKAQLAKWESGDEFPPPKFTESLRKFLPGIAAFDDLLPPYLRAEPKKGKPVLEVFQAAPAEEPEGWRGKAALNFGEGLKVCREKAGIAQKDLALIMGVTNTTVSRWEAMRAGTDGETFRMIPEVYDKLCEQFPMLKFAPKPPISGKFVNQRKTEAWFDARTRRGDQARQEHVVQEAIKAHVAANAPRPVDEAPANQAGAAYGVVAARLAGLKAKKKRMQEEFDVAMARLDGEIKAADEERLAAELEMERVANQVHGPTGAP